MPAKLPRILFFARDPGAANVVAEVFAAYTGPKVYITKNHATAHAEHLGVEYTSAEHIGLPNVPRALEDLAPLIVAVGDCSAIVTGTSHWDDLTDRLLWMYADRQGIPSIAVLDQWIRLRERFEVRGKWYMPDYLATPSEAIATTAVEKGFARRGSLYLGQPYLAKLFSRQAEVLTTRKRVRGEIAVFNGRSDLGKLIVFASEPFRLLAEHGFAPAGMPHDEREIADLLRESVGRHAPGAELLVKAHPKESDPALGTLRLSPGVTNLELIAAADLVIGIKSMFLIEAVVLGKRVLSLDFLQAPDDALVTNALGLSTSLRSVEELNGELAREVVHEEPAAREFSEHVTAALGLQPKLLEGFIAWLAELPAS